MQQPQFPRIDLSDHRVRVEAVAAAVLQRPAGKPLTIRKLTGHHQIHDMRYKDRCHPIDVSGLSNIIGLEWAVDTRTPPPPSSPATAAYRPAPVLVAVCEGQVSMKDLCEYTLARGFIPQVVPEYPNFTVAGLINGEGIQTSGFRHGVFSHTVTQMEIVLGDGRVVTAGPGAEEHRDLFTAMPESMGSLGIVTMARIMLKPSKALVVSRYELLGDMGAFLHRFEALLRRQSGDFLEALVVGPSAFLITHSVMAAPSEDVSAFVNDDRPGRGFGRQVRAGALPVFLPKPFSTNGEEYYYRYLRNDVIRGLDIANSRPFSGASLHIHADTIPVDEFPFRAVRGAWWMIEMHINSQRMLNQKWFRRKIDRKIANVLSTEGFSVPASPYMTRADEERCFVQQDMGMYMNRLGTGLEFVISRLGVYPLWLCPVSTARCMEPTPDAFIVDMGVYGEPTVQPFVSRQVIPAMQRLVDFPSTWGMDYVDVHPSKLAVTALRRQCREKYGAAATGAFLSIEEKCSIKGQQSRLAPANGGPIPHWRLVRDHGPYWRAKFAGVAAVLLVLAVLAACLFLSSFSSNFDNNDGPSTTLVTIHKSAQRLIQSLFAGAGIGGSNNDTYTSFSDGSSVRAGSL